MEPSKIGFVIGYLGLFTFACHCIAILILDWRHRKSGYGFWAGLLGYQPRYTMTIDWCKDAVHESKARIWVVKRDQENPELGRVIYRGRREDPQA